MSSNHILYYYLYLFNFRCKRDILHHLATCTDPSTKDHIYYDDSPFCPYPPTVSIDKSLVNNSEPLDFMSYFVDERLMEMAESEDPVQFFRKYMAGFVISKRESAVSHCGSVTRDNDVHEFMCFMFSTTPVVRNEPLFADSIARQYRIDDSQCFRTYDSTVSCSFFNSESSIPVPDYENSSIHNQYLNCSNAFLNVNTLSFEVDQSTTTNTMMIDNNFEVDGTIRHISDDRDVIESTVGRMYAPYGSNTEMMGATVYYNNQVIYCCHCNVIYILLFSHSTCPLPH